MSEEIALLRAVAAEPDDDLPRLIFADWCEENGKPRGAEFVRTHCRLASLPWWDAEVPTLTQRLKGLLRKLDPPGRRLGQYERGIPRSDVNASRGRVRLRRFADLSGSQEVVELDCHEPHELDAHDARSVGRLIADGVRRLRLSHIRFGAWAADALFGDREFPHLTHLGLVNTRGVVGGLTRSAMPRLRHLRVEGGGQVSARSVGWLFDWPSLGNVTDLSLAFVARPDVLDSLTDSEYTGGLRRLEMAIHFNPTDARRWHRLGRLPAVDELIVRNCPDLTNWGGQLAGPWRGLTLTHHSRNRFSLDHSSNGWASAIASSPESENLRGLRIAHDITDAELATLIDSPNLTSIETLDLSTATAAIDGASWAGVLSRLDWPLRRLRLPRLISEEQRREALAAVRRSDWSRDLVELHIPEIDRWLLPTDLTENE